MLGFAVGSFLLYPVLLTVPFMSTGLATPVIGYGSCHINMQQGLSLMKQTLFTGNAQFSPVLRSGIDFKAAYRTW